MRAAIRRKKESTNARRPPTVARTRYLSDWIVRAKEAGADPTKLRSHQITLRQRQNKQAGPSSNLEVYIGEEERANPDLGPPFCRFISLYQNFCTAHLYCEEASRSMPGLHTHTSALATDYHHPSRWLEWGSTFSWEKEETQLTFHVWIEIAPKYLFGQTTTQHILKVQSMCNMLMSNTFRDGEREEMGCLPKRVRGGCCARNS